MKLLFVNGCISQRGEESRTLVLARSFLDAWQARHPEAEVETVEPEALLALKPFAPEMLNDRDALAGIRCFDAPVYDLARQFRAADRVVVAAPFWDLTFPAALRTYIEYISANGLTYHYEADGCHGDCRVVCLDPRLFPGGVPRLGQLLGRYDADHLVRSSAPQYCLVPASRWRRCHPDHASS